jgi:rhamnose utilization protein RhaD (predicted bifunctional aldolase and dehydrogenase)
MNLQSQSSIHLNFHAHRLGSDISLVQGPGGNVSYKDDGVLWIKASGMRMADALTSNIFVGLDLGSAAELSLLDDSSKMLNAVLPGSPAGLRPSIETAMHAIIPSKVVSHVHSVGSVAVGVLKDPSSYIEAVSDFAPIAKIPYVRPGAPLARAILEVLEPHHKGLLLGNHGLTVWGDSFDDVEKLLNKIENSWRTGETDDFPESSSESVGQCNSEWSKKLSEGILVPDEAVLLGPKVFGSDESFRQNVIYINPSGVSQTNDDLGSDARDIARMLIAVGQHVSPGASINYLSDAEVAELLEWDMEKFRQEMTK